MSFLGETKRILRTRFIQGLLVVVPLILTFVLLRALVEAIDGLLKPLIIKTLGHAYDFPLIGIIVTFALIILSGIFTANVIGGRFLHLWERLIAKIPLVRFIYGSAKQLVQALTIPQNKSFKSVVMVEYPRRGVYALGFLVNQAEYIKAEEQVNLLSIFIPSTPTPISGFVVLFPESEVVHLDMTIEEGVKFFVSGSIISPSRFAAKKSLEISGQTQI
jgi:uncharacterized membrane protein